ncbi:hypothetical protein Dimus_035776 [Dionaea muscipula]
MEKRGFAQLSARPSKYSSRERVDRRSYSPAYDDVADGRDAANGYERYLSQGVQEEPPRMHNVNKGVVS